MNKLSQLAHSFGVEYIEFNSMPYSGDGDFSQTVTFYAKNERIQEELIINMLEESVEFECALEDTIEWLQADNEFIEHNCVLDTQSGKLTQYVTKNIESGRSFNIIGPGFAYVLNYFNSIQIGSLKLDYFSRPATDPANCLFGNIEWLNHKDAPKINPMNPALMNYLSAQIHIGQCGWANDADEATGEVIINLIDGVLMLKHFCFNRLDSTPVDKEIKGLAADNALVMAESTLPKNAMLVLKYSSPVGSLTEDIHVHIKCLDSKGKEIKLGKKKTQELFDYYASLLVEKIPHLHEAGTDKSAQGELRVDTARRTVTIKGVTITSQSKHSYSQWNIKEAVLYNPKIDGSWEHMKALSETPFLLM